MHWAETFQRGTVSYKPFGPVALCRPHELRVLFWGATLEPPLQWLGQYPWPLLVPTVRTTAKLLTPPPLHLKKALWELWDSVPSQQNAWDICTWRQPIQTPLTAGKRSLFRFRLTGLDASGYLTLVRRAREDCAKGTVSLHVRSTQWIWGCWAAQESQSRS